MPAEVYLRIKQKDRHVENWHFSMCEPDMILDVLNDIEIRGASYTEITAEEFSWSISDDYIRVSIHADLYEDSDGLGERLGYIEHYTVRRNIFAKLFNW